MAKRGATELGAFVDLDLGSSFNNEGAFRAEGGIGQSKRVSWFLGIGFSIVLVPLNKWSG
jgi:hypothetical protein